MSPFIMICVIIEFNIVRLFLIVDSFIELNILIWDEKIKSLFQWRYLKENNKNWFRTDSVLSIESYPYSTISTIDLTREEFFVERLMKPSNP